MALKRVSSLRSSTYPREVIASVESSTPIAEQSVPE